MQEHALAVIRARGGTVSIIDGMPRTGWDHTSFSAATVRGLAAQGYLIREPGPFEIYRLAVAAISTPRT